jgi:hypothetical protein
MLFPILPVINNSKTCLLALLAFLLFSCQGPRQTPATGQSQSQSRPAVADDRFYEMRTYYAPPGRLDDLHTRFRDHTTALFEKHGMTNIGYWVPVDNPENKLIYVLAYPSREAREASWKAFGADPEWQAARAASETNGKIVDRVESVFLKTVDYSPAIRPEKKSPPRAFELRTYTAAPGKLDDLHARFRNHTVDLFSKHGMSHVGYWVPVDADNTLIYILAHQSEEAGKRSFDAFRQDPDWVKAKAASEANGSLTSKVESVYMRPTDYSPTR